MRNSKPRFLRAPCLFLCFFLTSAAAFAEPQFPPTLHSELSRIAFDISRKLPNGTTVVIIPDDNGLSSYSAKELDPYLVKNSLSVLTRDKEALRNIDEEIKFGVSGAISEESAQKLGHILGAKAFISVSTEREARLARLRVKTVFTETTLTATSDSSLVQLPAHLRPAADKVQTGGLNILGGLGSYMDGDLVGGISISALHLSWISLFIAESALTWDSPAVGVPGTIGFCTLGAALVWGFVRPFFGAGARR